MKMSEEMAVRLHRMMWSDMQKELGDTCCMGRGSYKEEWLDKHFPGEQFMHNCFLCEYVMQQTGNRPLLGCAECKICPIKWPGDNCSLREREGGVNYLQSPISEILALPARNPEIDKPVENSYAEFRERLLSTYSGIPASSAIEDHVTAIKKKAVENKDRQLKQVLSTRNKCCDGYVERSREISGQLEEETLITVCMLLTDEVNKYKDKLSEQSGLDRNRVVDDHISAIKEKAVDEYFEERPGAKLATMDIDEAFKQYAKEQMEPIFHALAEASGLSSGNESVSAHIHEIVKNSMEAGATEERDRIQEKIYEVLLS